MSAWSRFGVAALAVAASLALLAQAAPKPAARISASAARAPSASASAATSALPRALVEKRIQRIVARAAERERNRSVRANDERRDLRRRLAERLRGRPITPAIRAELELHARRVARLRRARLIAAQEDDFDSVRKGDHALARENARHERWWRTSPDLAPAASASPAPSGARRSR